LGLGHTKPHKKEKKSTGKKLKSMGGEKAEKSKKKSRDQKQIFFL
jgi:hypothetical protein